MQCVYTACTSKYLSCTIIYKFSKLLSDPACQFHWHTLRVGPFGNAWGGQEGASCQCEWNFQHTVQYRITPWHNWIKYMYHSWMTTGLSCCFTRCLVGCLRSSTPSSRLSCQPANGRPRPSATWICSRWRSLCLCPLEDRFSWWTHTLDACRHAHTYSSDLIRLDIKSLKGFIQYFSTYGEMVPYIESSLCARRNLE